MSGRTIGMIVGGIIAVVAAYFTGGASLYGYAAAFGLGASLGGAVGGILDPPPGTNFQGPRLDDLSVQTSSYGAFIPRVYGSVAIFGNIFWLENNALKEVVNNEDAGGGGKGGKGGGATTTTYSYYATFALGLCEGPIVGIGRIWIGGKLYCDYRDSNGIDISGFAFSVKTGDENQLPDSRMQANLGIADTPAYRGLAYIIFYDLPLKDYGNSLAATQIKVEVVTCGSLTNKFELISTTASSTTPYDLDQLNGYVYIANITSGTVDIFDAHDVNHPRLIRTLDLTGIYGGSTVNALAVFHDVNHGPRLFVSTGLSNTIAVFDVYNPESAFLIYTIELQNFVGIFIRPYAIAVNDKYICILTWGQIYTGILHVYSNTNLLFGNFIGWVEVKSYSASPFSLEIDDDYAYITSTYVNNFQIVDLNAITPGGLQPAIIADIDLGYTHSGLAIAGNYAYISTIATDITVHVVDITDKTNPFLVANVDATAINVASVKIFLNFLVIAGNTNLEIFDIKTPTEPVSVGSLVISTTGQRHGLAITENYIYISSALDNNLKIYFFMDKIITQTNHSLATIIHNEVIRSNLLTESDIDTTELDQTVRGYRVSSQGSIRAAIEPLRGAWPFDVIQHGYQIKFVKRGHEPIATITEDELDARKAGSDSGVSITNSRDMDSQLPQKVSVKYFDYTREYDQGEQYAERINTDAVNVRALELPIVLTADESAQIASTLLYLYWMERYDVAFKLPPSYNYLEPGDVITLVTSRSLASSTPVPEVITPPVTPVGLAAVAISAYQIDLSWTLNTENPGFTRYKIYRDNVLIFTTAVDAAGYTSSGLSPNTSYAYKISAFVYPVDESALSAAVSETTNTSSTTINFWGGFDTGLFQGAGDHNWMNSPQTSAGSSMVTESDGSGGYWAKFTVAHSGFEESERSEVLQMQNASNNAITENASSGTVIYRLRTKFDTTWQAMNNSGSNGDWAIFLQLHGPDNLNTNPVWSLDAHGMIVSLRGGNINNYNGEDFPMSDTSMRLGEWIDWIVTVTYASTATGSFKVERKNQGATVYTTVFNRINIATLQFSNAYPTVGEHYMKLGLYRNYQNFTSIIYHDGFTREN